MPAYQRGNLGRVFNRANATAACDGTYAFFVIAGGEEEMVNRLYRRLRNYNPVPADYGLCDDGRRTRNFPIERVIRGPAFRSLDTLHLLQMAGSVAHSLLWQEDQLGDGIDGLEVGHGFGILDRALNRRAARRDPQGVVRR